MLLGIAGLMLAFALASVHSGRVRGRFGQSIERAKHPALFWMLLVLVFGCAFGLAAVALFVGAT